MGKRIVDLFCGAGGAAMGYHRAGFEVVGVDNRPQKRYPFEFIQADALEFLCFHGHEFDAIHASPPCQGYSVIRNMPHTAAHRGEVPMLIGRIRGLIEVSPKPYVIENVVGAREAMDQPVMLCGLMFGLKMFRHRLFESNVGLVTPEHPSHRGLMVGSDGMVCMCGHGDSGRGRIPWSHRSVAAWRAASGIDWMTGAEMAQAIPPAFTEYIGRQIMRSLGG